MMIVVQLLGVLGSDYIKRKRAIVALIVAATEV
jgi:hypothetical protein